MRWKLHLTVVLFLVTAGVAWPEVVSRTVEYQHGETQLVGYLAYDDEVAGRRPGVLVVHEWWGLNEYARRRARMLAQLGYVAFAADMYGKGKATEDPSKAAAWAGHLRGDLELWRERAVRGLEVLKKQPQTDPDHLAAIGYCFGGSTVLHMAFGGPPLAGVVSFHGGLPIPKDAASVRTPMLVCHGARDSHTRPATIQKFQDRLDALGADWMMITYGHAEHSFTNPAADEHGVKGVSYNEKADMRSWRHMRNFLKERFGKE
jgi:dienelactone hydrolase